MTNPEDLDPRDARVFNLGFTLRDGDLDDWKLVKTAGWDAPSETTYLWQSGDALARIVISQTADADQARERLTAETTHWMHPAPQTDGAETLGVGDLAVWCPDAEGQPATIVFVRGNALVGVYRADDIPFDSVDIATRIDRLLVDPAPEVKEWKSVQASEGEVIARWSGQQSSRLWAEAVGGSISLKAESVLFVPDSSDEHIVRVGFDG